MRVAPARPVLHDSWCVRGSGAVVVGVRPCLSRSVVVRRLQRGVFSAQKTEEGVHIYLDSSAFTPFTTAYSVLCLLIKVHLQKQYAAFFRLHPPIYHQVNPVEAIPKAAASSLRRSRTKLTVLHSEAPVLKRQSPNLKESEAGS